MILSSENVHDALILITSKMSEIDFSLGDLSSLTAHYGWSFEYYVPIF